MDISVASEELWTDSHVVLGYVSNEAHRFKTFVTNRVQFINEITKVQQWHYVSYWRNSVDYSSRELDERNLEKIHKWFSGPSFLWSRDK